MIKNLVKESILRGGRIKPLIIPFELSHGTGQMNPSILFDNGKLLVNLRSVGYVMIHSENEQKFPSRWGPLLYAHPENDLHLRTTNIYLELDNDYNIVRSNIIDTSILDVKPIWDFVGLEDARIVRWDGKLFITGVRRDTTPNGVARMELSEIEVTDTEVKEISRLRIESPNPSSYCEKNWMPIFDKPYHYVKWCNPTEIVKVNLESAKAETVYIGKIVLQGYYDWRGGSCVSVFDHPQLRNGWITLVHEVRLFKNPIGQKDAYYFHRFIVWDQNWNVVKLSPEFSFMEARIEFACGMIYKDGKYIITFGYQDNTAYIFEVTRRYMEELIYG
jgi:hypothetical protein